MQIPGAAITVVDKKPFTIDGDGITTISKDGIEWLNAMLDQDSPVDMIVPAIPVHVMIELLMINFKNLFDINSIRIPDFWLT